MKYKLFLAFLMAFLGILILLSFSINDNNATTVDSIDIEENEDPYSDNRLEFIQRNDNSNGGIHTCDTGGSDATYDITINCSDISVHIKIYGMDYIPQGGIETFALEAGSYSLWGGQTGYIASFQVTSSGTVDYDTAFEGTVLLGAGTSDLSIVGHPITIDASEVDQRIGMGYHLAGDFMGWTDPGQTNTFRLISNTYYSYSYKYGLYCDLGYKFASFLVEPTGIITYDESQIGVIEGNETTTIKPIGHSVTIDASEVDDKIGMGYWPYPESFLGWTDPGQSNTYKLVANTQYDYKLYSPIVYICASFAVQPTGVITYDESQVGVIKGNETSTVTLIGHPIKVDAIDMTKRVSLSYVGHPDSFLGYTEAGDSRIYNLIANTQYPYPIYVENIKVDDLFIYSNKTCRPNVVSTNDGKIYINYEPPGPPWYLTNGIVINGNQEWQDLAAAEEWCYGTGTLEDPYILENVNIDVQSEGSCITVLFTDVHFIIRYCTCTNSGSEGLDAGIKLDHVVNGQIINNDCSFNNKHGIYITSCENINIEENNLTNNLGNGLRLYWSCINNIIFNNTIENNVDIQLYLHTNCNDNLILKNEIIGVDKDGIYIYDCDTNSILENIVDITGTFDYGIYLWRSDNNEIIDNDKICGIRIRESDNTIIIGNYFEDALIWEDSAANTIVTENEIILLNQAGCGLKCGTNCVANLIYNNLISVNNAPILDDGINNQWDNDIIGNYWSDYSGQDLNDDGIGDSPYYIPGSAGSQDNYPIWDDGPDDITPPSTSITIDGILGLNSWYLSDVTITLTSTDASGVSFTEYSFDEITWITYTNPFTISTEGETTIYYRSVDNAGNIEELNIAEIKIDKIAPITELVVGDHLVDGEGNIYATSETEFSILATEEISGLDCIKYSINEGPWNIYIEPFTLEGTNGVYIIEYYGIDIAGNTENINSLTINLVSFDVDSFVSRGESNPITYFDVIFTKDKSSGGYKLVATNPGQIFYHIDFVNNWPTSIESLVIEAIIPLDFVLKASNPILIYLNGIDITEQCIIDGTVINLSDIPAGGVITVIIHLDYALKGNIYPSLEDFGLKSYTFKVIGSGSSGDPSIINDGLVGTSQSSANFFANQKKTTAIAGYVTDINENPIIGAMIELYDDYGNLIGTAITDENGFYYLIDIKEGDFQVYMFYESFTDIKVATAVKNELTLIDFIIPN